jgi:hypothetical protein
MAKTEKKILITGASGLIGNAAQSYFQAKGHSILKLSRASAEEAQKGSFWNPQADLEGVDAVVHLAGESITGWWTEEKKHRIRESRSLGTQMLCERLAALRQPPQVLVSASAVGYYGDRGEERLDELSSSGDDFLASVCRVWEGATDVAAAAGIRIVHVRFGIVLSGKGGALKKMLLPFRLGLGGILGTGRQYWSWVDIDDAVGIIEHAIFTEELRGPVNAVAPNPVTNKEFTATLGKVLNRPTVIPLPAFAARLLFGEMADLLLLASTRVESRCLRETRYRYRYPLLGDSLRHVLG